MSNGRIAYVSAVVVVLGLVNAMAAAADPPAATRPTRPAEAIISDVNEAMKGLNDFDPSVLTDEAARKEKGPKMLPLVKKITALSDEMGALDDLAAKEGARQLNGQLMAVRVMLGDKEAADQLEKRAGSSDAKEAVAAKSALLSAHWLLNRKDAASQGKMANQAVELAKSNPGDNVLTMALFGMTQMGSANHDLTVRLEDAILGMNSPAAQEIGPIIEAHRKLAVLENKPLVIKGTKNGGDEFSTESWKGKVVLVDFWATWCGPCLHELPRVKKAYATWHGKGLEIVGVSCDNDAETLNKFLKDNPDMPWPQLFDPKTAGWHPIATNLGVQSIPTMFLIDKKGVCRSVEAADNLEELIPKMLDEK